MISSTTSDRVALVTGASRGIGREVARALAAEGYSLTISARSSEALNGFAVELRSRYGVRVETVAANMSVADNVVDLAKRHADVFGRLDFLVLNAGMGAIGPLSEFPVHRLDTLYAVNLRSAFVLIQGLLPLLREAGARVGGGRVVAIASTTGIVGEPLNSAYGATKAGLITLCETLSAEESEDGVSATAVCPGYVATAMTEGLTESVPAESMLEVSDVVEVVLSLSRLSRRVVVPNIVLARPGPHLWRA